MIIALAAIGVLILIWFIAALNGFARLKQSIQECWANIEVQLKRRHDLIPQLVACTKGYAAHESAVFERIAHARQSAAERLAPSLEVIRGENEVSSALTSFMARLESYPDLKASQHFLELQQELANTEDRIAAARRYYNANVREYNARLDAFPIGMIGRSSGHSTVPYFDEQS